jgi:hypothetical protein
MTLRRLGRQRKNDISFLTVDEKCELFHGRPYFAVLAFHSDEEMLQAWKTHRKELRKEWAENNPPGTRCFAEWVFEIYPKFGERKTTEFFEKHCSPYRVKHLLHGILHTHGIPPLQETELEFLQRHNLLTAEEKATLKIK